MRRGRHALIDAFTWSALGAAVTGTSLLPDSLLPAGSRAAASAPPETIRVTGVLRDFRRAHPDFDVVPDVGYGHSAGNVAIGLGDDSRPDFAPAPGFKVAAEWFDKDGRRIAPHLFIAGSEASTVRLVSAPQFTNSPVRDTFNSALGPYGGANVGPEPAYAAGSVIPPVVVPAGVPAVGDITYVGGGTVTHGTNARCSVLEIGNGTTVRIQGAVTLVVETLLMVHNLAAIELDAGATLDLYCLGDAFVQDQSSINANTADPARVRIYKVGALPFDIKNASRVYATIVAPAADLLIQNDADFYGRFEGKRLVMQNQGGFHLDRRVGYDACGTLIDDDAGAAGASGTGGIESAATFDQWFADILGTNMSTHQTITLQRNGDGVYEFLADEFHPLDGLLFGNEGEEHNHYFTFALHANFTYNQCIGQFFEFEGADDAWAFIDDRLAMDLGGVAPGTDQHVDLDRLGLLDGESYRLSFFHARRQGLDATFRMRTNIPLQSPPVSSITGAFD